MSDILERLQVTHIPCTCFCTSKNFMEHNERCTHRVVREAEEEIRSLRGCAATLEYIMQFHPDVITQTYYD